MDENNRIHEDYQVGWICALQCELDASLAMLDERHPPLPPKPGDTNAYSFGRIGRHNVVMTCLPTGMTGTNSAARVATQMRRTFPAAVGLLVGIAGGVPSSQHDIRLGDVVVSEPRGSFGGVVEYDFGKTVEGGQFKRACRPLNKPSEQLLGSLSKVKSEYPGAGGAETKRHYKEMLMRHPEDAEFARYPEQDVLYAAEYDHRGGSSCLTCDSMQIVHRQPRRSDAPVIHYGLVASGNQVMRHGLSRDKLREVADVLCYEMEAAGLMDAGPFLVIRGICDYADSHKEKSWQNYAALMAAAYAKVFLSVLLLPETDNPTRRRYAQDVQKAREWVSPNPQKSLHRFFVDAREESTGEWFIKEPLFEKWMQSDSKEVLWVTGIPGAGKSILASTIIDHLDAYCKSSPSTSGMAYFYCTYREDKTQEIQQITASLVSQLTSQSRGAAWALTSYYRNRLGAPEMYKRQPVNTDTLCEILQSSCTDLKQIFLVIDAIDECRDSFVVARRLLHVYRDAGYPIKILLTSREDRSLMTVLEAFPKISLSNRIQQDIEIYLSAQMERKLRQQPGWCTDEMRKEILQRIFTVADNMFQLASYQWYLVSEESYNYDEIRSNLDSLPRTIDGIYRRILEKLESTPGDFELRRNILRWLVGSKRTMKLDELAEAIYIKDGQRKRNEFAVVNQPERLVRLCGSLVDINKHTNEVSLCHFSLKEFLVSDRVLRQADEARREHRASTNDTHSDIAKYSMSSQETHQRLATCCLTYLLFEDFGVGFRDRAHLDQVREKYKLLDYATLYAGEHLKELEICGEDLTTMLDELFLPELTIHSVHEPTLQKQLTTSMALLTFATYCPPVDPKCRDGEYFGVYRAPELTFSKWRDRQWQRQPQNWSIRGLMASLFSRLSSLFESIMLRIYPQRFPPKPDPLEMAQALGQHYMKSYMHRPTMNSRTWLQLYRIIGPKNQRDHHDNITPLYFTGLFNWRAGVAQYIAKGTDRISTSDLNHTLRGIAIGGSPLEEDKGECATMIQLLLEAGAEVDTNVSGLGSALQSAAFCGNLEGVNALIAGGASVNEKNGFNRPGGTMGSALQAAVISGNEAIVKMLLDQGAAVNQATGWVGTPLTAVLEQGMISMACVLLENGARPDIIGGYYTSSLHLAANKGESFLKAVLDRVKDVDVDVDVSLYPYGSPLHVACNTYNHANVDILLEKSADVHAQPGQFGTAIQAAAWSGSARAVRALLNHGANPNCWGISLITHASPDINLPYYGRICILRGGLGLHDNLWNGYLHDRWDDLFPRMGFYANSIAAALRVREYAHNKILWLFEFEPTHQEGHYGCPLQVAAYEGHIEVVGALIENNAEVNSVCGVFGTALEVVAYVGHGKVVEMILEYGADPEIEAGFYGLPLLAATVAGRQEVCEMLLEAGASPNATDEHGWTATDWQRHMGLPNVHGEAQRRWKLPEHWGSGWYKSPQLALGDDRRDIHFLGLNKHHAMYITHRNITDKFTTRISSTILDRL
ncbi:hypothetical protein BJX76DRAFT_362476 [Aspergillus varians]